MFNGFPKPVKDTGKIGKAYATGRATATAAVTFTNSGNSPVSVTPITVTGIGFKPLAVCVYQASTADPITFVCDMGQRDTGGYLLIRQGVNVIRLTGLAKLEDGGFTLPVGGAVATEYLWEAFG